MLLVEDDETDKSRRSSSESLQRARVPCASQHHTKLQRPFFDFSPVMLDDVRPPTTFVAVQELVGVVAEYCTVRDCVDTLQLVSHTCRSAVLDLPKVQQAHDSGISRRNKSIERRNNEIEREAADVRSYAELNAFLMLLMFVWVYPWVFLIWAAMPTAVPKHDFDQILGVFVTSIVGCAVFATISFGVTCRWLFEEAPLNPKARWVQMVSHIARCVFLLLSTIAGVVFLTRYQSACTTAAPSLKLPSARTLRIHLGQCM